MVLRRGATEKHGKSKTQERDTKFLRLKTFFRRLKNYKNAA